LDWYPKLVIGDINILEGS